MRRVRLTRRRIIAEMIATAALGAAGVVCGIAGGAALAHVVWRLILWGWAS